LSDRTQTTAGISSDNWFPAVIEQHQLYRWAFLNYSMAGVESE